MMSSQIRGIGDTPNFEAKPIAQSATQPQTCGESVAEGGVIGVSPKGLTMHDDFYTMHGKAVLAISQNYV